MNKIIDARIVLKEYLDDKLFGEIRQLQELSRREDGSNLKLELDYKLAAAKNSSRSEIKRFDEFMYYNGDTLIGYIGISDFGGRDIEVNGMVHPAYRRRGIFKTLFTLVFEEWQKRPSNNMLILTDRNSAAGTGFINSTGAIYHHTEYEMILSDMIFEGIKKNSLRLTLEDALEEDAAEISRHNAIYFGEDPGRHESLDIEEERKRGFLIYKASVGETMVGKVNLHNTNGEGGIYGLGILPEYRGRGLGRELLIRSVEKQKELGASYIFLQVDAENDTALGLYKTCGFETSYSMGYYKLEKKGRDVNGS
jgi:ribosomal protein S18 acetylase RimI-like enzyme